MPWPIADLQRPLAALEGSLQEVSRALRVADAAALESAATALQASLAEAIAPLRHGELSASTRNRLLHAAAEVRAQREALMRASASCDRAIGVLMPAQPTCYDARGSGERAANTGTVSA